MNEDSKENENICMEQSENKSEQLCLNVKSESNVEENCSTLENGVSASSNDEGRASDDEKGISDGEKRESDIEKNSEDEKRTSDEEKTKSDADKSKSKIKNRLRKRKKKGLRSFRSNPYEVYNEGSDYPANYFNGQFNVNWMSYDQLQEMERNGLANKETEVSEGNKLNCQDLQVLEENLLPYTKLKVLEQRLSCGQLKIANSKKLSCVECDYKTYNSKAFENHRLKHIESQLACDYCDFTSRDEALLEMHVQAHTELHELSCHRCEFKSNLKCLLEKHIIDHEPKEFPCNQCDFATNLEIELQKHTYIAHPTLHFPVDDKKRVCNDEERQKVIDMKKLDLPTDVIAREIGKSTKTVNRIWRTYRLEGTVEKKHRQTHSRVTTNIEDAKILNYIENYPTHTSQMIVEELNICASSATVRRRLRRAGYYYDIYLSKWRLIAEANK